MRLLLVVSMHACRWGWGTRLAHAEGGRHHQQCCLLFLLSVRCQGRIPFRMHQSHMQCLFMWCHRQPQAARGVRCGVTST